GGSFAPAVSVMSGPSPAALAVGDFNGDGRLDLAVANTGYGAVTTLLGDGKGGLVAPGGAPLAGGVTGVAAGDLDRGGRPDGVGAPGGAIAVLPARAAGTPDAAPSSPAGSAPIGVALGDFNRDGALDVATIDGDSDGSAMGGAVITLANLGGGK